MISLLGKLFLVISVLISFQTYAQDSLLKARLANFRDPFKRNIIKDKNKSANNRELKTTFTNRSSIQNVPIEDIKITGVFLGGERRAVAVEISKKGKGDSFIIKEGMRLGPDGIEVKAILPGGIVLVEKVINVYDEEEYLETIIPVSD